MCIMTDEAAQITTDVICCRISASTQNNPNSVSAHIFSSMINIPNVVVFSLDAIHLIPYIIFESFSTSILDSYNFFFDHEGVYMRYITDRVQGFYLPSAKQLALYKGV